MKYCDSEAVPYKVSRCCVVTLVTPDHLCYLQSVIKLQVYHCPHLLAAGRQEVSGHLRQQASQQGKNASLSSVICFIAFW